MLSKRGRERRKERRGWEKEIEIGLMTIMFLFIFKKEKSVTLTPMCVSASNRVCGEEKCFARVWLKKNVEVGGRQKLVSMVTVWGLDQIPHHSWVI